MIFSEMTYFPLKRISLCFNMKNFIFPKILLRNKFCFTLKHILFCIDKLCFMLKQNLFHIYLFMKMSPRSFGDVSLFTKCHCVLFSHWQILFHVEQN